MDADTSEFRFNTGLLADRIEDVIAWISRQRAYSDLAIGLHATGTCGAAALRAAARHPDTIAAVVCRAPRTELVLGILGHLCAETLLILGETDTARVEEARRAQQLAPPGMIELGVIDGGRPMLEAPSEREAVGHLASRWFARAFAGAPPQVLHDILVASVPGRAGTDTNPARGTFP